MAETDLMTLVNSCVLSQEDSNLMPICAPDTYQGEEIDNKQLVLNYLKSFKPAWFTSASVIDPILQKKVSKPDNLYNDGVYEWSECEVYLFEKYNMPLNEGFVLHCIESAEAKGDKN